MGEVILHMSDGPEEDLPLVFLGHHSDLIPCLQVVAWVRRREDAVLSRRIGVAVGLALVSGLMLWSNASLRDDFYLGGAALAWGLIYAVARRALAPTSITLMAVGGEAKAQAMLRRFLPRRTFDRLVERRFGG